MKRTQFLRCPFAFAALVLVPHFAGAQCPGFEAGFHVAGTSGAVRALETFDDGSGVALYAGGEFLTAGNVAASRIARWDGAAFVPLGSGVDGTVHALVVHDEGAGDALYAGGAFTSAGGSPASRIARWDGANWSPLGAGLAGEVTALTVFDDGTGSALYAGGRFAGGLAKWDGASWSIVGGGLSNGTPNEVFALTVLDDGLGGAPLLYAGGQFRLAGGVNVDNVARWDGQAWSSPGSGIPGTVRALATFDDGAETKVYAGGPFGVRVWNGATWASVASSLNVVALEVFDDGSGPALVAGAPSGVSRWNGASFVAIPGLANVHCLRGFDRGAGPRLCAGGLFVTASGSVAYNAAVLEGSTWTAWVTSGLGLQSSSYGEPLTTHDEGFGPRIYTGAPGYAGGTFASSAARFDGAGWTALPALAGNGASLLCSWDDGLGGGPALFADRLVVVGGSVFYRLDRYAHGAWSTLATFDSYPQTMQVIDDGNGERLFIGGAFSTVTPAGGAAIPCSRVVTWNGTSFAPFGSGLVGTVQALALYDDGLGAGPSIYAGGGFFGSLAQIARWNGSAWESVGGGVTGPASSTSVIDLRVFDDGSGAQLYACGRFASAGGVPASCLARWNGGAWSDVGGSLGSTASSCGGGSLATALEVFDDGTGDGPALYVFGAFDAAGGIPASGIARWNGSAWSNVGGGVRSSGCPIVWDAAVLDDGSAMGPALWVSGQFELASGVPSVNVARLRGCGDLGQRFCAGDGSGTACPCGNDSTLGAGAGCANSTGRGAALRAQGLASVSADSLVLACASMTPSGSALYFQGTSRVAGGAGVVFGDGLRCVGGAIVRLGIETSVLGASTYPGVGDAAISTQGSVPAGATRHYQVWFRDSAAFCTSASFNLSNGLTIVWQS